MRYGGLRGRPLPNWSRRKSRDFKFGARAQTMFECAIHVLKLEIKQRLKILQNSWEVNEFVSAVF